MRRLIFCEDESAANLTHAILQSRRFGDLRHASIVWGDGDGYLRKLQGSVPRPPAPDLELVYVFDGDQRLKVSGSTAQQWPVAFLPTDQDPDSLFKGLAAHSDELALIFGLPVAQLLEMLDALSAEDPHDWVNALSLRFGRAHALRSLSSLWCRMHPDDVEHFIAGVEGAL
jgi:hypothetical protein